MIDWLIKIFILHAVCENIVSLCVSCNGRTEMFASWTLRNSLPPFSGNSLCSEGALTINVSSVLAFYVGTNLCYGTDLPVQSLIYVWQSRISFGSHSTKYCRQCHGEQHISETKWWAYKCSCRKLSRNETLSHEDRPTWTSHFLKTHRSSFDSCLACDLSHQILRIVWSMRYLK